MEFAKLLNLLAPRIETNIRQMVNGRAWYDEAQFFSVAQEAVWLAYQRFVPEKHPLGERGLVPFCMQCARKRIFSHFKDENIYVNRRKKQMTRHYTPGGDILGDIVDPYQDIKEAESHEEWDRISKKLEDKLSVKELTCLYAFSEGDDYSVIAQKNGWTFKDVDNALTRARRKLKEIEKYDRLEQNNCQSNWST